MKIYVNIDGTKLRLAAEEVLDLLKEGRISEFNKDFVEHITKNKYEYASYLHSHWDIGFDVDIDKSCKETDEKISQKFNGAANALMQYYGFDFNKFSTEEQIKEFEEMVAIDGLTVKNYSTFGIHNLLSSFHIEDKRKYGSIFINETKNKDLNKTEKQPGEQ